MILYRINESVPARDTRLEWLSRLPCRSWFSFELLNVSCWVTCFEYCPFFLSVFFSSFLAMRMTPHFPSSSLLTSSPSLSCGYLGNCFWLLFLWRCENETNVVKSPPLELTWNKPALNGVFCAEIPRDCGTIAIVSVYYVFLHVQTFRYVICSFRVHRWSTSVLFWKTECSSTPVSFIF